ncbi:hypothetical protein SAMN02745218_02913 [Desulfofundulus australicus DSM 11792]|uniref:Uncharacterized protein n=1 Tax=Desulfofundulus australicus DSM 11792 TaxID=1121425 RepID=A0A1M5DTE9_9FIRM|nr:hypothetical protein SAMN02745218_02913 [Desulfofundulus australicus DSM 11792]
MPVFRRFRKSWTERGYKNGAKPVQVPIEEDHPLAPTNPYGATWCWWPPPGVSGKSWTGAPVTATWKPSSARPGSGTGGIRRAMKVGLEAGFHD